MNVLIIDDYEIIADGVIKRVKKVFRDANCIFVNNVRSAYSVLHNQSIDLVLCDLEFDDDPEHDGFYIVKELLSLEPRTKIIALTHYNSYRLMKRVEESGFLSYLNKGCSFGDFSDTLINVVKQGRYKSATERKLIKKRLEISKSIFNDSLKGICLLSDRELEITIITGKTTNRKEIAHSLSIKPYTVDSHIKNAISKLNLSHRKDLSIFSLDFQKVLEKEYESRIK